MWYIISTVLEGREISRPVRRATPVFKRKKIMEAKEFWDKRIYNKNQHRNALIDLREILETPTFSEEEKIYLRQAIDWLEYLEKRHPVNDEKFEKKYGPPVSEKDD